MRYVNVTVICECHCDLELPEINLGDGPIQISTVGLIGTCYSSWTPIAVNQLHEEKTDVRGI